MQGIQAPNQNKTASEIQSQLNRLNELLNGLDKEIESAKEAYSVVIVTYDSPVGNAIGANAPAVPMPPQSPMARVLDTVNMRLQIAINELSDMRNRCQL
jgi:hypothetical protein